MAVALFDVEVNFRLHPDEPNFWANQNALELKSLIDSISSPESVTNKPVTDITITVHDSAEIEAKLSELKAAKQEAGNAATDLINQVSDLGKEISNIERKISA